MTILRNNAMLKEKPCCRNCACFEASAKQSREDKQIGQCRALPPVFRGDDDVKMAKFPVVVSDMWCWHYWVDIKEKENG